MRLRDYNYNKILISTICTIMALTLSEWYSIIPWRWMCICSINYQGFI
jgi:hypothetical protein